MLIHDSSIIKSNYIINIDLYFMCIRIIIFIICSMLSKFGTTKPLYSLQRGIAYQKHKKKLMEIQSKSPNMTSAKSVDTRPWAKQKLKIQLQKQNKLIEQQNGKLLYKLMKISTRNSLKSNQLIHHRDNPFRKNWLMNIKRENQELGQKLINLRSSLQYSRFSKSICQYQKVKKSMKINRRPRLPQLGSRLIQANNIKKKAKTQPNQQMRMTKTINTQKMNTQPQINENRDTKTQLSIKVFEIENDEHQQVKMQKDIQKEI